MNSKKALWGMKVLAVATGLLSGAPAMAEVVGTDAWTRATAPGAAGVGYLVLTNKGSDTAKLIKIVSPVCDRIMIHRSSIDENGIARMWAVGKLEIAPGESVRFAPNGLHVMFMEMKAPFRVGQQVPLQLTFEGEPEITVMLEVKPLVPDEGMDHKSMSRDSAGRK
jgi:copper(I)-binding protein